MKKNVIALLAGILLIPLTLAGCGTQQNNSTSDVKKITYILRGTDLGILTMYVLTSDCTMKEYEMGFDDFIHYDLFAGELPPEGRYEVIGEYKISEEEWNALVSAINENNFAELPEELPAGRVTDAAVIHMQVETADWTHETGGYMAGYEDDDESKRFRAIKDELWNIIEAHEPQP